MGAGCLWRSASAPGYHLRTLIDIATPHPRSPQYAPFIDDGDDFLSQICQMQIFFSLLSTIILQTNPNSPMMAVLLPMLIAVPPISGFVFESGILDELKKVTSFLDNGLPIPFTGGRRVGVGCRSKTNGFLERLLGVKEALEEPEEDVDTKRKAEKERSGCCEIWNDSALAESTTTSAADHGTDVILIQSTHAFGNPMEA